MHNRFTGVYNEEITLYCIFYKKYNNQLILSDPILTSETKVTIKTTNDAVLAFPESTGSIGSEYFPVTMLTKISKGVMALTFNFNPDSDLSVTQQTQYKDVWENFMSDDGIEFEARTNIFFINPKSYFADSSPSILDYNITLQPSLEELRIGEKKWIKFEVVDNNNAIKNIDNFKLNFLDANGVLLRENLAIIAENLSALYFLDTEEMQAYLNSKYMSSTKYALYPIYPSFTSVNITNKIGGDNAVLSLYSKKYGNITLPNITDADLKYDPEKVYKLRIQSSSLAGKETLEDKYSFDLKENDGDYARYSLPYNVSGLTGSEAADIFAQYLTDQKDALKLKKENYKFSAVGDSLHIVGADTTDKLMIKYIDYPRYASTLHNDFDINSDTVSDFNEVIQASAKIISGPIVEWASVVSTKSYTPIVKTNNTYDSSGIIATSTVTTGYTSHVTNSTDNRRYIKISQNDGEPIIYTLPKYATASFSASVVSYLESQASKLRTQDLIDYEFGKVGSYVVIQESSVTKSVRKLTLLPVDNDAYFRLGGGFAVSPGESLNHYGSLTPPDIHGSKLTNYVPRTRNDIFELSENGGDFHTYNLPAESYSFVNLAPYLEAQKPAGVNYYFSAANESMVINGERNITQKLTLKNTKQDLNAYELLEDDFVVEINGISTFDRSKRDYDFAYSYQEKFNSALTSSEIEDIIFTHTDSAITVTAKEDNEAIAITKVSWDSDYYSSLSLNSNSKLTGQIKINENTTGNVFLDVPYWSYVLNSEVAASLLATYLNDQIPESSYYYFSNTNSILKLYPDPFLTSSLSLSCVGGNIEARLGGDFAPSFVHTRTSTPITSCISSNLFSTTDSKQEIVSLDPSFYTTEVKPIVIDDEYQFELEVEVNYEIKKIAASFSFTE